MSVLKVLNWFSRNKTSIYWFIFGLGLISLCFIQYYGVVKFHYIVPPGDDPMNHWRMILPLYNHTSDIWEVWKQGGYPSGFHLLIASLSHLFNAEPMKTMVWFYPSIIIFSSVAIFFLTKIVFGRWTALLAFFIYAFTAESSIQLLNDGGYPNLIAAHIFIPLFLGFLFLAIKSTKRIYTVTFGSISVLFALLILFTHHISTFYLLGIILLSIPFLILSQSIRNRWKWHKNLLFLIVYILSLGLFLHLFKTSELFAPARSLSNLMVSLKSSFPFYEIVGHADPAAIPSKGAYLFFFGYVISIFGFFGFFYSASSVFKKKQENSIPVIILLVWTTFLLMGSRLQFLTNPERMARDLVVPMTILAANFIVVLFKWTQKKTALKYAFVILVAALSINALSYRLRVALDYAPMVRFTNADKEAVNQMLRSRGSGRLFVFGLDYYFDAFMPGYKIDYYDQQTAQVKALYFDDTTLKPQPALEQYNYVYVVNDQKGWVPPNIKVGLADSFISNPQDFKLINSYISRTNETYLFEVIK